MDDPATGPQRSCNRTATNLGTGVYTPGTSNPRVAPASHKGATAMLRGVVRETTQESADAETRRPNGGTAHQ